MERLTNNHLIEIAIALFGSIIAGWLIKKFLFPVIYKLANKTKWKSDDIVIESFGKWVIFWFILGASLYILPIFSGNFTFVQKNENIIRSIIASLFIFSLTMLLARISKGVLQIGTEKTSSEFQSTSILGNVIRAIIYCFGLIFILNNFGVAIAPLVTALGVGGIAVALALQPTLSNLFAGIQLLASGKINIGDFVELDGGQKGFIRDISWRNTTIENVQNNIIVIPNSKMADSIVENFFLIDRKMTFSILVGVSYNSDLEKVEKVSINVAKEILKTHVGGIKEFEPFARFYNFGDSSIDLKIFLQVREFADQFEITSDFIKLLHKRYGEEGINIPFPIRTVLMNNKTE